MKNIKKRLFFILTIILMASTAVSLIACNKPSDEYKLVEKSVSHMQQELMTGKTANLKANLSVGKKEKQFVADGKVGEMYDFCILTVTPLNLDMFDKKFTYVLTGTNGELKGEMEKNILGVAFSSEIADYSKIGTVTGLVISCNEVAETVKLESQMAGCITAEKALEYAYNALKEALMEDFKDNKFNREVYIKFINDRSNETSPHYWYVSMLKDNEHYVSVLINPIDGKIISKKI